MTDRLTKPQIEALIVRADAGERVAAVGQAGHLNTALDDVLTRLGDSRTAPGMEVRLTNGQQEVRFPSGGRLLFLTSQRLCGFALSAAAMLHPVEELMPALIVGDGAIIGVDG